MPADTPLKERLKSGLLDAWAHIRHPVLTSKAYTELDKKYRDNLSDGIKTDAQLAELDLDRMALDSRLHELQPMSHGSEEHELLAFYASNLELGTMKYDAIRHLVETSGFMEDEQRAINYQGFGANNVVLEDNKEAYIRSLRFKVLDSGDIIGSYHMVDDLKDFVAEDARQELEAMVTDSKRTRKAVVREFVNKDDPLGTSFIFYADAPGHSLNKLSNFDQDTLYEFMRDVDIPRSIESINSNILREKYVLLRITNPNSGFSQTYMMHLAPNLKNTKLDFYLKEISPSEYDYESLGFEEERIEKDPEEIEPNIQIIPSPQEEEPVEEDLEEIPAEEIEQTETTN